MCQPAQTTIAILVTSPTGQTLQTGLIRFYNMLLTRPLIFRKVSLTVSCLTKTIDQGEISENAWIRE
jgi:hypothetical protein